MTYPYITGALQLEQRVAVCVAIRIATCVALAHDVFICHGSTEARAVSCRVCCSVHWSMRCSVSSSGT